jgi:acetyl-CoA C-acetyltransferase
MSAGINAPVYILGSHQTDFARVWSREGLDLSDMVAEAVPAALHDAQLDAAAIGSIHVGNAFAELQRGQAHLGALVAELVPALWGVPAMRHEGACASSSLAVLCAMAQIQAGHCDTALVLGVEELKNLPGDQSSRNQNAAAWVGREDGDCRFMWPAAFGRLYGEYLQRYPTLHEADLRASLHQIAALNYANARHNPLAQTRRWLFADDAFSDDDRANPVIEPGTRRQDCGQITDGACALVLASESAAAAHAARLGVTLASLPRIAGWGHRNAGISYASKIAHSQGQPLVFPHLQQAIAEAWRRAGIHTLDELDAVETHDCFTMTEYLALDHLGFDEPGFAWRAIERGDIAPGGRLPVNPSGGLIGGGHPVGATGARMLHDAARQVTGRAGDTQVPGARRVATLNIGGSCATVVSFVVAAG